MIPASIQNSSSGEEGKYKCRIAIEMVTLLRCGFLLGLLATAETFNQPTSFFVIVVFKGNKSPSITYTTDAIKAVFIRSWNVSPLSNLVVAISSSNRDPLHLERMRHTMGRRRPGSASNIPFLGVAKRVCLWCTVATIPACHTYNEFLGLFRSLPKSTNPPISRRWPRWPAVHWPTMSALLSQCQRSKVKCSSLHHSAVSPSRACAILRSMI